MAPIASDKSTAFLEYSAFSRSSVLFLDVISIRDFM
jgi:hypothetical protein